MTKFAITQKPALNKKTLKNLSVRSSIKAGGCSKNWSYAPSKDANGCRGVQQ